MGRERRRFTLVELLVVVVIIAMLAALLLPVLARARRKAYVTLCIGNLRQVGQGLTMYTGDNSDFLPTPELYNGGGEKYRAGADIVRFKPDSAGFTYIPVISPYFGNTLNDILRCPLAVPIYQRGAEWGDYDNYRGRGSGLTRTPYNMYFGGGSVGEFNPAAVNPIVHPPNYMKKLGDAFTLPGGGNDGEGKSCFVLASDIVTKGIGKASNKLKIRSTHPSLAGDSVDAFYNYTNGSVGWVHWMFSDANFLTTDGSVRHYPKIMSMDHHNGSQNFYHHRATNGYGQAFPKDMCE